MYAGMSGQVLRVSVGSAAQLSTFDQIKHIVSSYSYFESHPNLVPVMAAAVAGIGAKQNFIFMLINSCCLCDESRRLSIDSSLQSAQSQRWRSLLLRSH